MTMLAWANAFASGALRSSSEISGLGVANLAGDQPSTPWRTAGATSAWFEIDAGAAIAWDIVALCRRNDSCTASSTLQYLFGTAAGLGDVYSSPVLQANVVPGYQQSVYVPKLTIGAAPVARYLHVAIADPTNPDGSIAIGAAYAGPAWTPQWPVSWGYALGYTQDRTTVDATRGGQEWVDEPVRARQLDFQLDFITEAEKWLQAMEMERLAGQSRNVLVIKNEASPYLNRETVFGRLAKIAPLTTPARWNENSRSYSVRERL